MAEVGEIINGQTAEAEKIFVESQKVPPGILTAAVQSGRLKVTVKSVSDPTVRQSIVDMMERAVKAGFYEKMPDPSIIYTP